jgi:SAM-dependent methyltransferase
VVLAALEPASLPKYSNLLLVSRLKRPLMIPEELHRNAPDVHASGPEHTGSTLIQLVLRRLGLKELSGCDVLDVGCGVRFTQAIINRDIPIKSYTGIDVHRPLIEYLTREVDDRRFSFAHWDVENGRYNPGGVKMTPESSLPIQGTFDIIWLFSVFTHLDPSDTNSLLAILRRYVRPGGALFFSAFLDNSIDSFEVKIPGRPLDHPCYSETYMRELAKKNGWHVLSVNGPEQFIQHNLVCRPATEPWLASTSLLGPPGPDDERQVPRKIW